MTINLVEPVVETVVRTVRQGSLSYIYENLTIEVFPDASYSVTMGTKTLYISPRRVFSHDDWREGTLTIMSSKDLADEINEWIFAYSAKGAAEHMKVTWIKAIRTVVNRDRCRSVESLPEWERTLLSREVL